MKKPNGEIVTCLLTITFTQTEDGFDFSAKPRGKGLDKGEECPVCDQERGNFQNRSVILCDACAVQNFFSTWSNAEIGRLIVQAGYKRRDKITVVKGRLHWHPSDSVGWDEKFELEKPK